MGVVRSVNVGAAAAFRAGRSRRSAIVKAPVAGPVAVRGVNLEGDEQADRRIHGGPEQALYAYPLESHRWWEAELGRPLAPGTFGENLTLEGVDADGALIGERWAVGTAVLEVTGPRTPCLKLQARLGEPRFVQRFAAARRPGAYLAIVAEGTLQAGDDVEVLMRPDHGITVAGVNEALLFDHAAAAALLASAAPFGPRLRARLEKRAAASAAATRRRAGGATPATCTRRSPSGS